jgi:hypothetical protein
MAAIVHNRVAAICAFRGSCCAKWAGALQTPVVNLVCGSSVKPTRIPANTWLVRGARC